MLTLRPPQAILQATCLDILNGSNLNKIIADVAPGGGKSKLPVILASLLIPKFADRLLWIVPRNSLKYQGEAEFLDPRMPTDRRMRAANGNETDPGRGTDGYITTYQAVGMLPEIHQDRVCKRRTILFLDEPHHAADDSSWGDALAPMIDAAALVVFASGTFSRHDGAKIHGLDYNGAYVDLRNRPGTKVIRYSRSQALADGSILPVELRTIDGAAEWISKEGVKRKIDSLHKSGTDRSDALFSMLRTEYAFQLLAACLEHWQNHRKEYPAAKLLVVAPDIETAKEYQGRLAGRILSEIATSDDGPGARRAIADFKRGAFPALVTVGMAYEGLSVPEITHIACLTQIRSKEWLEQMQARANRVAPGKRQGWCFAPKDRAFLDAWAKIEREALTPLADDMGGFDFGPSAGPDSTPPEGFGFGLSGIEPLWSSAHGITSELSAVQAPILTASQSEKILLENIRAIYNRVVLGARPGSGQACMTIYSRACRSIRDVSLEELNTEELTAVWMKLREVFGKRL
jgi:superfamily II DNA or RNA helicase